jgi:DNA-binding NarL/FixJ family response regulator
MHTNKIRIVVNDDHDIFREGMLHIIRAEHNFMLCSVIQPGENLVEEVANKNPDVVITSIHSKNMDCVEATRAITEKLPHIGILAITTFQHEHGIINMLQAGAKGCLLRNAQKRDLVQAIRSIHKLEHYYSAEIRGTLSKIIANSDIKSYVFRDYHQLTEKDILLLRYLCQELTLKEISTKLNVSVRTLEHRKNRLYELLGKSNTAGLINYAIINGIYNPFEAVRS